VALIGLLEVDTIYWFLDFEDEVRPDMAKPLIRKMRDKKIRIYLVTVGRKSNELLVKYSAISEVGVYRQKP